VCFGILSGDGLNARMLSAVMTSARPYGGLVSNPISKESPTVVLPAVMMVRAYAAICAAELVLKDSFSSDVNIKDILRNHVDFYDNAKDLVRRLARKVIQGIKNQEPGKDQHGNVAPFPYEDISREMDQEEAGYLGVHLAFVPVLNVNDDSGEPLGDSGQNDSLLPPDSILKSSHILGKRDRKRFRGNDPTPKQGGDPRVNLLKRIRTQGMVEKNDIQRILDDCERRNNDEAKKAMAKWLTGIASRENARHSHRAHAAVWRNPFYVGGLYTKAGRNISQSPFYVPDGPGGKMVRKGTTSVEEEICSTLSEIGCGGISFQNNDFVSTREDTNGKAGVVVFGLCKFHASGREDIDVRMLLPPIRTKDNSHVGGRPFVCEVIDAFRVPSIRQLSNVMGRINRMDIKETSEVSDIVVDAGIDDSSSSHIPLSSEQSNSRNRRYGRNPNGVDIAKISYCTSTDYKGLQGETENKVKHYGCAVWCEMPIKSQEELDERLGVHSGRYPMEIHQSTPLRVLHRRAAAVRSRHVLTLSARWVNEHWFGLHLSATAGSYIKELVHGDLGRTSPSISSILGCKTDIVRLDCEGIAM
jgi:tRNA U54 and U55 pseudouridine synthase Pus10